MAVIDDLVVSGLSLTQAQAVIGVDAGTATAADLVAQGLSVTQAAQVIAVNAGTSDIIGIYNGRFIALEVKKPETRKRVTEKQTEFLATIKQHGGIAAVVTSPEEALMAIKG